MAQSKSRLGRGLGGLISGSGGRETDEAESGSGGSDSGSESRSNPASDSSAKAASNSAGKPASKAAKKTAAKKPGKEDAVPAVAAASNTRGYREIPLQQVAENPYQPRRESDPQLIEELAQSIRTEGLLQPVVVREKGGQYELIAGERRVRAYRHLQRETIPARVIEASDASSAALALIENLQRENLNPVDEALGYSSLLRDFDLTQEAAAERVGKGRATVANALRLLTLGSEIQGYLSRRLLSTGHAKVLLGVENEEQRKLLARRIIETGMSVREAEKQVRRLKEGGTRGGNAKNREAGATDVALRDLERRIGEHLNTRVALKHSPKRGKLTIEYFGNEDLERILQKLGIPG